MLDYHGKDPETPLVLQYGRAKKAAWVSPCCGILGFPLMSSSDAGDISLILWITLSLGMGLYSVVASHGKLMIGWIGFSISVFFAVMFTLAHFIIW
jgi:hypothetical protein